MKAEKVKKEAVSTCHVNLIKTIIVKQGELISEIKELNTPQKAAQFIKDFYRGADREYVFVCTLDNKCHPISIEMASMGTLDQALVSPREIFKSAILSCASSIILFHNHLSGNPEPSTDDMCVTRRMEESGAILGIPLLDHIIVGEGEQFVSLRERKAIRIKNKSCYVTG